MKIVIYLFGIITILVAQFTFLAFEQYKDNQRVKNDTFFSCDTGWKVRLDFYGIIPSVYSTCKTKQ